MSEASASVFLRVLQDALLGPPGSADLLLPAAEPEAVHQRRERAALLRRAGLGLPMAVMMRALGLALLTGLHVVGARERFRTRDERQRARGQ